MYLKIKKILDRFFGVLAFIVFLPLMLIAAFLIVLDGNKTVFFKQERVGYNEKKFLAYKFRTMKSTKVKFNVNNPVIKDNNPNVTKIGKFLRKTKIDELPQLINIIKGEMSFVGPRPFLDVYYDVYEDWELKKFDITPGLTGLAQIRGNSYLTTNERSYYDIMYIKNLSFWQDVKIFFLTIKLLFVGEDKMVKKVSPEEIEKLKEEIRNEKSEGK